MNVLNVSSTDNIYIYRERERERQRETYIVRASRPVIAVVVLCPLARPAVPSSSSVLYPSVPVRPDVVVRPLPVRPAIRLVITYTTSRCMRRGSN